MTHEATWRGKVTAVPRTLADWVTLWFGSSVESDDPRDVVRPLLTFNSAPDETWRENDVQVLVVENQGVWLWGLTDAGEFVERLNEEGVPWRRTGEDAAAFWLHHAAFEATYSMAAQRSSQFFDDATVAAIINRTSALPCGQWAWPGSRQRMFYRGASLVMVCEDAGDFWSSRPLRRRVGSSGWRAWMRSGTSATLDRMTHCTWAWAWARASQGETSRLNATYIGTRDPRQ
jgi:hypothetical protein